MLDYTRPAEESSWYPKIVEAMMLISVGRRRGMISECVIATFYNLSISDKIHPLPLLLETKTFR
jgi:hypothetical protein